MDSENVQSSQLPAAQDNQSEGSNISSIDVEASVLHAPQGTVDESAVHCDEEENLSRGNSPDVDLSLETVVASLIASGSNTSSNGKEAPAPRAYQSINDDLLYMSLSFSVYSEGQIATYTNVPPGEDGVPWDAILMPLPEETSEAHWETSVEQSHQLSPYSNQPQPQQYQPAGDDDMWTILINTDGSTFADIPQTQPMPQWPSLEQVAPQVQGNESQEEQLIGSDGDQEAMYGMQGEEQAKRLIEHWANMDHDYLPQMPAKQVEVKVEPEEKYKKPAPEIPDEVAAEMRKKIIPWFPEDDPEPKRIREEKPII